MARRKATNEDSGLDWLDAELKALPDLDEGLDFDLPDLDLDFTELDKLLKFDEVQGLSLNLSDPAEQPASALAKKHTADAIKALATIKSDTTTGKTARRDAKRALNRHTRHKPTTEGKGNAATASNK